MATFEDLGLSATALTALKRLGFEHPTPIQEKAIPQILVGQDIIAAASTGTGKTAAFLLPTLSALPVHAKGSRPPRILVITPTRELAEQITFTAMKIAKVCGHYACSLVGGKPYGPQIRQLREGTDALIVTPGRLCDLIDRGVVDLSHIEVLILDEADRMLDMGFLPAIKRIVELIPTQRQTLLFSATIDKSIQNNLVDLLDNPAVIQIAQKGQTAEKVDQFILPVAQKDKAELLKCFLDEKQRDKVIVFARTRSRAEDVAKMLKHAGYSVECIHSDRTQGQRKHALASFRQGKATIIVATDVLARGIDIPEVDYVVNYDLPDMPEDYIHRIGRTGRADASGFAVSFVSNNSLKALDAIERLLRKSLPVMRIESFDVDMSQLTRKSRSGKKLQRPRSKKQTESKYDYTGYGDLRNGDKKKTSSKAKHKQSEHKKKKKAEHTKRTNQSASSQTKREKGKNTKNNKRKKDYSSNAQKRAFAKAQGRKR